MRGSPLRILTAKNPTPPVPTDQGELSVLINFRQLCELMAISTATGERLKARGALPRHIELSPQCHRWRRSEVLEWIGEGCPARREFEARHGTHGNGRPS
jgi:predicted DNA-binding transcriptional regulator AlpA